MRAARSSQGAGSREEREVPASRGVAGRKGPHGKFFSQWASTLAARSNASTSVAPNAKASSGVSLITSGFGVTGIGLHSREIVPHLGHKVARLLKLGETGEFRQSGA